MAAQAGWYPDPSGNIEKLRFWDGERWTNDFMDAASVQPIAASASQAPAQQTDCEVQPAQQIQPAYQPAQPSQQQAQQQAQQQSQQQSQQQAQQPYQQQPYQSDPASPYGAQQNQNQNYSGQQQQYQPPHYGIPVSSSGMMNQDGTYFVNSNDSTLRLIAFILYMIELGGMVLYALPTLGLSLICLAWLLPMSLHCWKVYKGQKPNTIAFGVCTLLFCNLIAGILLLVSTKEVR